MTETSGVRREIRKVIHLLEEYMKGIALARHEAVNGWFKHFRILQEQFRNHILKYYTVFSDVAANVTQLCLMMGYSTFDVDYRD